MNTECLEKNIYQSMTWCPGRTRTPGVRKRVYFLPKHFILGWPEHGSGDNKGKYVGNFTLADGKYFNYMDVVTNDSKITAETQGEYPCKTFRQHGEAFYPGLEEDITDFEEKAINDDLVFVFQLSNGKFKVVGCEEYRTDVNCSSDTGSAATDKMGVTITIETDAPHDCLIYEGRIPVGAGEDANPSD